MATDVTETIGERLRRLRLERGLSQRDLSAPGISYAYISRIEAGARRPSVKALRLLGRKLGVSAEYLETGSEIHDFERRELRLAEAELTLRLDSDRDGAVAELESILAEAVAAGDAAAAARARTGLGYAAAEKGDHARAVELLEQAVESGVVTPTARPDVFTYLGRTLAALGHADRAVDLLEEARARLREEAPGDPGTDLRLVVALAGALADLGEGERAQALLRDAAAGAGAREDPYATVRLYRSLGRAAGADGRPQVSLDYLRRALALLDATDDTHELARAHLACAWAQIGAGALDEAGTHLGAAERLLGPHPDQGDLVTLRRHQAELARRQGDGAVAIGRAREAIELAGDGLPAERGTAWHVVAEAHAAAGETAEAERAFAEAAALLDEHGSARERAECYRAWGRLLRSAGREAEALDVLERAADFAVEARAGDR